MCLSLSSFPFLHSSFSIMFGQSVISLVLYYDSLFSVHPRRVPLSAANELQSSPKLLISAFVECLLSCRTVFCTSLPFVDECITSLIPGQIRM
jgi:hypothetical protein